MTDSQSTALAQTGAAGSLSFLTDSSAFEHTWRVAKAFSSSRMVPQHFQQKPEDCMVALMMAQQLEVNPLLALQNLQVINGRPGFSASFAIGLANKRGPFHGPITWESSGQGDSLEVTAKAIIKATGEEVRVSVSMAMAKAEGWVKNPKYRSIPEQMLRYRSATWLIRLYAPDVLLGFGTSDEAEDIAPVKTVEVRDVGSGDVVADLNAKIKTKKKTAPAPAPEPAEDAEYQELSEVQAPADEPVADDPF
jgi:hypothetical protein